MQPDLDDVLQTENVDPHLVPVKVCEPVESRELPSKRVSTRTVPVGTAAGVKLLSADPRRKFATIIGRTQDLLIGANQAQAQLSGSWIPGSVPFIISTVAEVWATGDGGATDVSVIEEYYA
jgi:hypothetical protein